MAEKLGDLRQWQKRWKKKIEKEDTALGQLASLWGTPLGRLAKALTADDVPSGESLPDTRGDDLLPLDLDGVMDCLGPNSDADEARAVLLLALSLNYLWLGGRDSKLCRRRRGKLTKVQEMAVQHLAERVRDLATVKARCCSFDEGRAQLTEARFDYAGEPVMALEELKADLVIPIWPKVGEAAVQPVEPYLPPEMVDQIRNPTLSLLPVSDWPRVPPKSRVMATQSEWDAIVAAGSARGLMVGVAPEEVFCDVQGNKVVNGAAAVKKTKKIGGVERQMQRFISNFIPINAYQCHIKGGDRHLPYLGQLTLLEQEDDEVWLVDSEDFTSCYNLFRLPSTWHRYMCFEKTVDASLFGGPKGKQVHPAMAVVPMGWLNAVSVVQAVVRTLVFEESEVPEDSEISKLKALPQLDDLSVIYLDSFDELRRLDRQCAEALQGTMSERHKRFLNMCREKGLPLNEGKRLVSAYRGTLQGGELQGDLGWYKLAGDKQVNLVALGSTLLAIDRWKEFDLRHYIGKAVFGMCFRRPLLSIFQDSFSFVTKIATEGRALAPPPPALDEVILVMACTPMMGSSLGAQLCSEMTCSDASPSGGGVAVAERFFREPMTKLHEGNECWVCNKNLNPDFVLACPARCGVSLCGLECVIAHRSGKDCSTSRACIRGDWELPRFGERFAGKRALLTEAVAAEGGIDVQPPFDWYLGHDFFSAEGKAFLEEQLADPLLEAEHWAPCCKLFSKARGRPIHLPDGRVLAGPQPVRDHRNVMGFKHLSTGMKVRLRHSNAMATKSLKRAEQSRQDGRPRIVSVEHPKNSWMWEFTLAKELLEMGFIRSHGSHCCFGGPREKWFEFRHNCESLRPWLEKECPGHEGLLPYTVVEDEDGQLIYDTAQETEYPWLLCKAYAHGLKDELEWDKTLGDFYDEARLRWLMDELALSTERLGRPEVCGAAAVSISFLERGMKQGEERAHLRQMLARTSYRGTEMRAYVSLGDEAEDQHEVPYPAHRWHWKTILSFPWDRESHINELEMCAVLSATKHRCRASKKFHQRWFLIVDSMVTRGALAKGRSPSRRLNRLLRKQAALSLAQNSYLIPLWTISRWNFSDEASRRFEKKN
eukprot:Skav219378  [mRNA]  locus=scaffold76:715800:719114:- [translate_table: standard]